MPGSLNKSFTEWTWCWMRSITLDVVVCILLCCWTFWLRIRFASTESNSFVIYQFTRLSRSSKSLTLSFRHQSNPTKGSHGSCPIPSHVAIRPLSQHLSPIRSLIIGRLPLFLLISLQWSFLHLKLSLRASRLQLLKPHFQSFRDSLILTFFVLDATELLFFSSLLKVCTEGTHLV